MRILMTADTVGGVWSYALDLARALPAHQFTLATMGKLPTSAQREAVAAVSNARLKASEFRLEWMENPWQDVARAGQWLLDLERQTRPDIVHLNGFAHGITPFRAPTIVVGHSCVCSWFEAVQGIKAPANWNCYREKVRAGLGAATAIVAPTRAFLDELNRIYGPLANARAIYNGAAPSGALAIKEPFILAAGRVWDEAKNIALLDRIAVKWPIRVAGDAALDGAAFEAQSVELLGFLQGEDWLQTRARTAIWAHPARYEPFGLAILEAALDGCALVLSDIPTLRELWDGAAIFARPDDELGWTRALNQLINDADLRAQMGAKARARAAQFSLQRFGAGYEALYRELSQAPLIFKSTDEH